MKTSEAVAHRPLKVKAVHAGNPKTVTPLKVPDEALGCGFHEAVRGAPSLFICSLGHRFDIKRAGANPDPSELHLAPFPLLTPEEGSVKVAIAPDASAGHPEATPTNEQSS